MATWNRNKWIGWMMQSAILFLSLLLANTSASAEPRPWSSAAQKDRSYVVLAWNNLGMHCYNPDFRDLAVLPPYNTIWAQVVKVGDPPQVVTSGITIEYQFPHNTYSTGKTNFWTWAQQIFDLNDPLPPNIGLTGKGLTGKMDLVQDIVLGDHFEAEGIPLTEYDDSDKNLQKPSPYQMAQITVLDITEKILAQTMTVAPVSSELQCINCHATQPTQAFRHSWASPLCSESQ